MGTWTLPTDYLPNPSADDLYLVTLDWGFRRPLQLAVAKFQPSPGNESVGHWTFPYWPQQHIAKDAVLAWQPAPAMFEPVPALAESEAAR
jgi:hypothetical protein